MGDGSFGFAAGELETIVRLEPADHPGRDLQRHLRLDQGRPEDRLRRALLLGRFLDRTSMPGSPRPTASRPGASRSRPELKPALAAALAAGGPTLVDVVTQPLHEARAPVSEWVA